MTSESWVPARQLVRKRGEYIFQFPPIEVIPRAEEAGPEDFRLFDHFGERLGDGRLSSSCEPIEPEDVSVLRVLGPLHDFNEHRFSSPAEAGVMVTGLVSCVAYWV